MKIAELLQEEFLWSYTNRLQIKEKIKRLGRGVWGQVFQHPTHKGIVVKVYNWNADKGYTKFLKWALKNQQNPYLPKIVETHFIKGGRDKGDDIGIVFMKKLVPAPKKMYNALYNDALAALKKTDMKAYKAATDEVDFQDWNRSIWAALAKATDDKHFADFARFMASAPHGDLHDENIMMDPANRQIVITDPLSYS